MSAWHNILVIFGCMLPIVVAQSSSGVVVIRYVLPVCADCFRYTCSLDTSAFSSRQF